MHLFGPIRSEPWWSGLDPGSQSGCSDNRAILALLMLYQQQGGYYQGPPPPQGAFYQQGPPQGGYYPQGPPQGRYYQQQPQPIYVQQTPPPADDCGCCGPFLACLTAMLCVELLF